jgi:GNAT superfamily N-acetyltransferase
VTLVRPAVVNDVERLLALTAEMDRFYGATALDPLEVRRTQLYDALFGSEPVGHVLLAFDGESVAGFASYSHLWPAVGLTRSLYLKELFVSQAEQRHGVGRALMESVVEVARASNCSRVEWTADRDNPAAQAFYQYLGLTQLQGKLLYRLDL